MRVFVSGGTGFVGGHLRRELVARGHSVRLLVHRRSGEFEAGVEPVEGDATKPDTFASAMEGCDAAINLVGIIREFPSRGITFQRLHVWSTANILNAAKQYGVRRYLQMSALGVRAGAVSAYHGSKYEAENLVRESSLDFTIFRPSVIYGPKDDFINKLVSLVRLLPAVPVIGDGRYRLQPINADDVARCFATALELPATIGQTYHLCGPDRLSYNELLDLVGRVLGKGQVAKIHSPMGLVTLAVPLLQRFPAFPITMDQITMLKEESICDGTWRETFGFVPTPLETGIRSYLSP